MNLTLFACFKKFKEIQAKVGMLSCRAATNDYLSLLTFQFIFLINGLSLIDRKM